jgi:iron(III) transport system substrate-binding protein
MKSRAKFAAGHEAVRKPGAGAALLCAMLLVFVGFLFDFKVASGQQWKDVLAKGRDEGEVVLGTSLGIPSFRQHVVDAFAKRFGIKVELRVLGAAELGAAAGRECAAGRPSMDVLLSGNSELLSLYPKGCLAAVRPKLLFPETASPDLWRGGRLKFNDPENQHLFQTAEHVLGWVIVNRERVKPQDIKVARDLLKPEFKEKMVSYDPRRGGSGQSDAAYLLTLFGEEFIQKLYVDQKVAYTSDHRQQADWVARGVHWIGLGSVERIFEPMRKEGLPIGVISLQDAAYLAGGSSVLKLVKDGPHPNAATVLLNWLASREGQEIYSRTVLQPSRRTDVNVKEIPEYLSVKPGVKYVDSYDHEFYAKKRPEAIKALIKLLGR